MIHAGKLQESFGSSFEFSFITAAVSGATKTVVTFLWDTSEEFLKNAGIPDPYPPKKTIVFGILSILKRHISLFSWFQISLF